MTTKIGISVRSKLILGLINNKIITKRKIPASLTDAALQNINTLIIEANKGSLYAALVLYKHALALRDYQKKVSRKLEKLKRLIANKVSSQNMTILEAAAKENAGFEISGNTALSLIHVIQLYDELFSAFADANNLELFDSNAAFIDISHRYLRVLRKLFSKIIVVKARPPMLKVEDYAAQSEAYQNCIKELGPIDEKMLNKALKFIANNQLFQGD